MKNITRITICILLALSTLPLMAFTGLPSPQAASLAAPTRTPRAGQQIDQEIVFAFQREQNWLELEQIHITQAGQVISKGQALLDKAQSKGVDVADLSAALAAFTTEAANARTTHDQAAAILNARNGFDANGNVVDRQAAHQTVLDALTPLRQTHLTLAKAVLDLRIALQTWRLSHNQK